MFRTFPDVVTVEPTHTHTAHWTSKIVEVATSQNKQKNIRKVMRHDLETLNTVIRASESLRVKNDILIFRRRESLRDQVMYMYGRLQLLSVQFNNFVFGTTPINTVNKARKPRKSPPISSPRFEGKKRKAGLDE